MLEEISLKQTADLIVQRLLAVRPSEQVALVCDSRSEMEMVECLTEAVSRVGAEFTVLMMPVRPKEQSNQLTRVIEKGLQSADCLIGLTGGSGAPTYSAAVKDLYKQRRLRGISMVFRGRDHFCRGGALADYEALRRDGVRLKALWEKGRIMEITTPAGTRIRAPIAFDDVILECGFATEPGEEAAFSDGEVSCRPLEGKAEGVIVVDGPICFVGKPTRPIRLTVKAGRVTSVAGESKQAAELQQILETIENADNIAEFGIGLNPRSLRNGDFEEEKKARGLVHIALGDNIFYGGKTQSQVHMDMVLYQPTVRLDDRTLVENGAVTLD